MKITKVTKKKNYHIVDTIFCLGTEVTYIRKSADRWLVGDSKSQESEWLEGIFQDYIKE